MERLYSGINDFFGATFPASGLSMEVCRASPRSHSGCDKIRTRPTPNADTLHGVDVRTLLRYFNTLYCKLTVISWLNDCEDMKLLVPTPIVLFH